MAASMIFNAGFGIFSPRYKPRAKSISCVVVRVCIVVLVEVGWWIISRTQTRHRAGRIDMVEVVADRLERDAEEQFHHLRLRVAGSEKTRGRSRVWHGHAADEFTHE